MSLVYTAPQFQLIRNRLPKLLFNISFSVRTESEYGNIKTAQKFFTEPSPM